MGLGSGSRYSTGKSYDYKAYCDVCKFKFWAHELRARWDGLQVCKWDWEARHPMDFYKTRNDAHKLPWTRPSDGSASSATPDDKTFASGLTGVTAFSVTGETYTLNTGSYFLDTLQGKTHANFTFTWDDVNGLPIGNPQSVSSGAAAQFTLPTTPGGAGSGTIINSDGKLISTFTITAGNATVTLTNWTKKKGHFSFSCIYIT